MKPPGPDLPPLHALRRGPLAHAPEALARRVLRRWFLGKARPCTARCRTSAPSATATRWPLAALARAEAGETCNLPLGLSRRWRGGAYLYLLTQRDEPLRPAPAARPLPVDGA